MAVFIARLRLPVQYLGLVSIAGGIVLTWFTPLGWAVFMLGLLCALVSFALSVWSPIVKDVPLVVASPVRGRWMAVNSPSTKIPSHGTHAYGQTYAVDLLAVPPGAERPEFGKAGRAFLPPQEFPAFGQPLFAPADAVVVKAVDGARDHLSRSNYPALAYLMVESMVRELRGITGVLGNHVVLRLQDGTHFVMAHLKRGSVAVSVGDAVSAGAQIGECGNSGNSTEPHVHCQRQDVASTFVAVGLPWTVEHHGIPEAEGYIDA